MNKNLERLYFAYLTEHREVGQSTPHSPQHLTLVPPFLADRSKAIQAAESVSHNLKQFPIRVGGSANFGENHETKVYLVEPVQIVRMLHNFLLDELQARDVDLNRINFIRDDYVPHITKKERHQPLQKGQRMVIDHIGLMLKTDKERTLIHREDLRQ